MASLPFPLPFPPLNEVELQELINQEIAKIEVVRRDLCRKYQEQIAEQELSFRQRLYQLYLRASSSQHEVLQAKSSKKLQQESSRSLESGLSERSGWCSLCEVDCNTEKVLKKHILGKKHQSMLKKVKQGSEDKGEAYSKQQRSLTQKLQQDSSSSLDSRLPKRPGCCLLCEIDCNTEKVLKKHILGKKHQSTLKKMSEVSADGRNGNSNHQKSKEAHEQHEREVINNLDKKEKQMKEEGMYTKKMQQDSLSLDPGLLKRPGWCSLCESDCNTEKDLKKHILGKKHQSILNVLKQGSGNKGEENSKQPNSLTELQQQDKYIIDNIDKQEKQMKGGGTYIKKMQPDNSRSLDSGLPDRPGWCSLCEVGCNTDKELKKHILGKKHQSTLKIWKQDSGNKREGNSNQQNSLTKLQKQDAGIIENLNKQENQMKEGGMYRKKMQHDSSRSLHSGFPEQPGWCSLCEVECNNEKDLEIHISGKKHQSKLKMLKQDIGFPEQPGWCSLCDVECNTNSEKDLEKHIWGKKHQSKLKMLQQDRKFHEQPGWCSLCEVECNSEKVLEKHVLGKKHQSKLKMLIQDIRFPEQPGWCSLCEVECNSEKDLEKHILGKKHQLKLKMLKQSGEENSKQVKPHAEHEQQESDIIGNLDKREKHMKQGVIPSKKHKISLNSSQITAKGCEIRNSVFSCQADFESHLAGREHEMQLRKMENPKTLSEVENDSTKYAISGGKELIKIECGLLGNDNVEKRVENKLVLKINADRDIGAKDDKVDMKGNADVKMSSNARRISKGCVNADGKELRIPVYESHTMDDVDKIAGDKIVLGFKDDDLHNRCMVRGQVSPWQRCVLL